MTNLKAIERFLFCIICIAPLSGFAQQNDNPFLTDWNTPYGVPPFEKIFNKHYMPAFLEGMKQQKTEISAIISSKEIPDFNNTILLLDNSGELLRKVSMVFYALNSANSSKCPTRSTLPLVLYWRNTTRRSPVKCIRYVDLRL